MQYFALSPEVAGGLGCNTVMSRGKHPPLVSQLHYELDGWLGDDLLESFPCFVITQRLATLLRSQELSGYELKNVEISTSDQFREFNPDLEIPHFSWLDISGKAGVDDFGVDQEGRLVVSNVALDVLKSTHLDHCAVLAFNT